MTIRVLVSYHYHRDTDLDQFVEQLGGDVDLFADSGAYSAYSTGAVIDREDYARWLARWDHLLSVKSNLDVIGDPAGGAACVLGSEHGCLANRGARKPGAVMVTGSFTGIYDDPDTRRDLLSMLGGPSAYR